ncbi:IclR family transcriptional regulator [Phytoactinopolyspora endophytica]|uniref:IclR family transcriptional regulator n=1 Tax=Phytoactinopolyspora endophytica TaxID=1642495 RepID=UPI00101C4A62|nr:IclR family transcriptional regulator [Phytoactinopolyspora endophytica]
MTSAEMALRAVLLIAERGQITVTELALALEVAPSTAHRVLANCRQVGFVRQDDRGGPYVRGPALHEISLLASRALSLRDAVDPVLHDLRDETGASVGVMILEGRNARIVNGLIGDSDVVASRVGRVFPAHRVAGGKAILATETPEKRRRRLGPTLPPLADGTTRTWEEFEKEMGLVRRRGWAHAIGQSDPAIGAIAAPVVLASGDAIGALTLALPRYKMSTRSEVEAFAPELLRAATRAQSRLRGGAG